MLQLHRTDFTILRDECPSLWYHRFKVFKETRESLVSIQNSRLHWKELETWLWNEEVEDSQEVVEEEINSGFNDGRSMKSSNTESILNSLCYENFLVAIWGYLPHFDDICTSMLENLYCQV